MLDVLPEDPDTLDHLLRLYRRCGPPADLLDVLERRRALARAPEERRALTLELGELLADAGRGLEAIEALAEVLAGDPADPAALARLAAIEVGGGDSGARAAAVLLPIHEASGDDARTAEVLARLAADGRGDPRARLGHLRRLAELREHRLGDPDGALDALIEAAGAAAAEPELPALLGDLARLAADRGRLGELIDVYRALAAEVLDGELARRLRLDVADLALAVRGDLALARRYYQEVLEAAPDDPRALAALEGILRQAGELAELHDVIVRKADRRGDDLDARVAALSEAATLSRALGRPGEAIAEWEQVLELLPDAAAAADALEELYLEAERWHDLTDLIERRLGFALALEDAVALRLRLGELCERELADAERAIDNYAAALGGDPTHPGATAALERLLEDPGTRGLAAEVLEPIYVARQEWARLVRIYQIKLDAELDPSLRLRLTRYIARLHEDQLDDLEGAFRWYGRVFRENPRDAAVRSQLVRLAGVEDGWAALADIYQDLLDDTPGHPPEVREVALALADVADRRLGEVERALAAYRRVLAGAPGDEPTFARAEELLIRGGRWLDLVELYRDRVAAAGDDPRRVELHRRAARVWEERLGDSTRAIEELGAALALAPDDPDAVAELERLLASQRQWLELADLLAVRIERAIGTAAELPLRLRLAELLLTHQGDAERAIDQWEQALDAGDDPTALAALERLIVDPRHRERIAGLLEPIYRKRDWWQKLVVILDARLGFVERPLERVEILREIARLHAGRGGDLALALAALARAWLEDPIDDEVYAELAELAERLAAWDELAEVLERALAGSLDVELELGVLRRLAEIEEVRRGDLTAAIAAHERVVALAGDDPVALLALDRLLSRTGDQARLVEVLARRAASARASDEEQVLLARAAALYEHALGRAGEAIDTWQALLSVDPANPAALEALERLYRAAGAHAELARVLGLELELAAGAQARALHLELARLFADELGAPAAAIVHLREVLDLDAGDREALARLEGLYREQASWPELVEVLDRRAILERDPAARAELGFRAAEVVRGPLADPHAAVDRLAAVLAAAPGHPGARAALDDLTHDDDTLEAAAAVLDERYRADGAHDARAALIERKLAAGGGKRPDLFARLAALHEGDRGDPDAAFRTLARALAEAPDDRELQAELERLAAARAAWPELVEVYAAQLAEALDPVREAHYATLLGRLHDEALGDLSRSAAAYRRAIAARGDDEALLELLARVLERAGEHAALAEVLERQAEVSPSSARQAELRFRLGDLRQHRLGDLPGAVHAYREVLERDAGHAASRSALERLLADEAVRRDVVVVLEPLYAASGDAARLADLLATKLALTVDPGDRAALYARLAELAEHALGDGVRALDAVGGWLAEDPGSAPALAELERLAAATGRWPEAAVRLRAIAGATDAIEIRRELLGRLGAIERDALGDLAAATATFAELRTVDPEAALPALEGLFRATGQAAALAEVLEQAAERSLDAGERRRLLVEAAGLRDALGDGAAAVARWRQVLELDEGDREALARLVELFEQSGDLRAQIDVLATWARFARDAVEERALYRRIAELEGDVLGDLDAAARAWSEVLALEPDDREALAALEHLHARRGDAAAVHEVLLRELDLAASTDEQIAVLRRLAILAEHGPAPAGGTPPGASDEAAAYLQRILELDPGDGQAHADLERLLTQAERWHDLVDHHGAHAAYLAGRGERDAEVRALAAAAEVWERRLGDPAAAGEILERLLVRQPRCVPALLGLARIYQAGGEDDRARSALERALALDPVGVDAAEVHVRLGELGERAATDEPDLPAAAAARAAALAHFDVALRHSPADPAALAGIERVARATGDRLRLADALHRQLDGAPAAERPHRAAVVAGMWIELGRPEVALPLLERANADLPADPAIAGALADSYAGAGRFADAAPLYDGLVERARRARQLKDVARYRQRQAALYAAAGDRGRALAAYEEAFRIDPAAIATMIGLARLYLDGAEWDKARRVLRSLVLQNLDPAAGITKAEVYLQLGVTHRELGEADRARAMFQRGLELEPANPALREALARM